MTERIVDRHCVRPGCTRPAVATLAFRYDTRQAWLSGLAPEPVPATYDLCGVCAGRTNPPRGWYLVDERPDAQPAAAPADAATVAVLAAALSAPPDAGVASTDPAASAAVDGPAIDDTELVEPPADGAGDPLGDWQDAGVDDLDTERVAALRPVASGGAVVRSEPYAPPTRDRVDVRPVMAALLGEAEGPMVSLHAVDDLEALPTPSVPAEPERSAGAVAAVRHEAAAAVPDSSLESAPAAVDHGVVDHDTPRLFAVPSHQAERGTASVW